ncbi:MAG: PAS domain S-box protein, partial [Desulfobacteraceae bacterium]|nr:PAS domain S-box protein [Desulfobacteraceae bacterium]
DIIMPQMDGFETCRRLKEDDVLKTIPVIFLSALSETKDKVKGLKIGAVDYITKPIETAELLARIDLHLTLKSLQENLEQQVHIRTQELLKTNKALRKRDEDYRSVMKAVPDPIIVYDLEGKMVYLNPAFTRIFGWAWEELDGKKPDFVVEGEWEKTQEALKKTYKQGYITDFETRRYTKQGKTLDVSISGASYQNPQGKDIGIVVNLRDITEWKQTQEVMIQNEKMMSLGGLAAGMAHEIKNPLSAIIQNSQVLQNRLFEDLPVNIKTAGECNLSLDTMRDYLLRRKINSLLDSFLESGQRVNIIIDNMLSFSRKSESKFIPCDLAELMDKTIVLAKQDYDLKKNYDFRQIKIIRKYKTPLPKVPCEGSKIQQVFFNILKNGSEAMNEEKKRALERGLEAKDSKFTIKLSGDKDSACIEIEDNG